MTTEPHPATKTDRSLSVFILFSFLSLLFLSAACKKSADASADRFYKSLSVEDGKLYWSLNVGVLNDGLRRELDRATVEPLLTAAVDRVTKLCPAVSIRFIADQPLDADYIIDHTVRRRSLSLRSDRESPVLFLTSSAEDVNTLKLKKAGRSDALTAKVLERLRDAEKHRDTSGVEWLSNRSSGSAFVWRAYLREQVRYDLVLTNAYIFPDELNSPDASAAGVEGVETALWEAEGRTAGEGTAGLVSLFRFAALEGGQASLEVREAGVVRLADVLSRIVLGGQKVSAQGSSVSEVCRTRETYLRAAARFEKGERKEACAELGGLHLPDGQAASEAQKSLLAYCAKNG